MVKKDITWKDYDGNERTETFYFALSRSELLRLESSYPGGFRTYCDRLMKAQNAKELNVVFDEILELAYGVKSDDGRNLRKGKEYFEDFKSTGAYDQLYMELMTSDEGMENFINGLMPPELMAEIEKEIKDSTSENKDRLANTNIKVVDTTAKEVN